MHRTLTKIAGFVTGKLHRLRAGPGDPGGLSQDLNIWWRPGGLGLNVERLSACKKVLVFVRFVRSKNLDKAYAGWYGPPPAKDLSL
jgi:hypothetical protein